MHDIKMGTLRNVLFIFIKFVSFPQCDFFKKLENCQNTKMLLIFLTLTNKFVCQAVYVILRNKAEVPSTDGDVNQYLYY